MPTIFLIDEADHGDYIVIDNLSKKQQCVKEIVMDKPIKEERMIKRRRATKGQSGNEVMEAMGLLPDLIATNFGIQHYKET